MFVISQLYIKQWWQCYNGRYCKEETLWLSQKGMSKVFEVGVSAISKHLKNIFQEKKLDKNSVVSKMEITAENGKKLLYWCL